MIFFKTELLEPRLLKKMRKKFGKVIFFEGTCKMHLHTTEKKVYIESNLLKKKTQKTAILS